MKNILVQIKNEWRASLFLFIELLLVFVVLWYIVDWTLVTVRVYHAPMGFDTEHCYNISVSKLSSKSAIYNPSLTTDDDMQHLIELTERLRHRPGVEAVALSQNCFPYNDGSNGLNVSVDSVSLNTHLLWVEPDFFRVFRYSASDEETLSQMAAAIRDNHLVVSSNLLPTILNCIWMMLLRCKTVSSDYRASVVMSVSVSELSVHPSVGPTSILLRSGEVLLLLYILIWNV